MCHVGEARAEGVHCLLARTVKAMLSSQSATSPSTSSVSATTQFRCRQAVYINGSRVWAPPRPNPSVKGTSRKRAAPYLER
jgi:hypothetical protein